MQSVARAASSPPVTASGMFQRRSGAIRRLTPAPMKNTTIEMVKVSKPGVSIVVILFGLLRHALSMQG